MIDVKATRSDVRQAQRDYSDHIKKHQCSIGDGCETRIELWHEIGRKALLWNVPSDELALYSFV